MSIRSFLAFLTLITSFWAQTSIAAIAIDNFRTGLTPRISIFCNVNDTVQLGSMVGGIRRTRLIVNEAGASCSVSNKYRQTAAMQIRPSALIVNGDFKVFHRLEIFYGQDELKQNRPLNLDLTEGGLNNRRIRIAFEAMDLVENFNIVLFMKDGSARSQCSMNINPSANPFTIDFPLDNFGVALGTADYSDVDYIALIFQSGSAMGSNDFTVKSVTATSAITPGVLISTCS